MQIDSKTLLCRYRYDALNRLVASTPTVQADTQRFYLKDRLTTEIQGAEQRSIMQHEDQLLAQQQRRSGTVETRLLATDQQRSVLNVLAAARPNPLAYTPYGHRHPENGLLSLLGFNGERPDAVTGHYLLGNGYRAFNPVLMRFNSPDSWSPFGEGGLNRYAYCVGDPRNKSDSTGHADFFSFVNYLRFRNSSHTANKSYRAPASINFLKGKYKKTEQGVVSQTSSRLEQNQTKHLQSTSQINKNSLLNRRMSSNRSDSQAEVSSNSSTDGLRAALKTLLVRDGPSNRITDNAPLRKVISVLDKEITEEETISNIKLSIYKNPDSVMELIRSNRGIASD